LYGASRRALAAETEPFEYTRDMRIAVSPAEVLGNQLGHPRQGPQLCRKPRSYGASLEQFDQFATLLWIEVRGTAYGAAFESCIALACPCCRPSRNRLPTDIEFACDFGLAQSLVQ